MRISTRLATEDDKAAIWTLYQFAMKRHIEAIWGWDKHWQVTYFDDAFSSFATYVIVRDGQFGGYYQLQLDEQEVYLGMIVLMPEARSAGIGSALLPELLRCSHQAGRALRFRVFRVNHAARRFYERLGWQVQSEDEAFFTMTHARNDTDATSPPWHDLSPKQFLLALDKQPGASKKQQ